MFARAERNRCGLRDVSDAGIVATAIERTCCIALLFAANNSFNFVRDNFKVKLASRWGHFELSRTFAGFHSISRSPLANAIRIYILQRDESKATNWSVRDTVNESTCQTR